MNFTMKTPKLNAILSQVSKGVGGSSSAKMLPVTGYLKLTLKDNVLSITATDMQNFITYSEKGVIGANGEAIVHAESLIKLVSKTTKSDMTFKLTDTALEVKGNGSYKVELFESNEFPSFKFNDQVAGTELSLATLKKAFAIGESAIAHEMLIPCLVGYKMGDIMVSTDSMKMAMTKIGYEGEPMLLQQKLVDLVCSLNVEKVTVKKDGNKLMFITPSITIFGAELDGIEEYPEITGFLALEYPESITVKRKDLLETLDRMSVFVKTFDNHGVRLSFTTEGLQVEDLRKNNVEVIEYTENKMTQGSPDIVMNNKFMTDLLSVLGDETVTIHFGDDLPIKFQQAGSDIVQILSTMEV